MHIEETSLWAVTLGQESSRHCYGRELERLRGELYGMRHRVSSIVSGIACSLPGLTIHDVTHLDALWDMASLIAGPEYPINPLEAFVFGGAVLLHDSALCFEAYEKGLAGIRSTTVWKDAYASAASRNPGTTPTEVEAAADFSALRGLHAQQAKKLAQQSWTDPDTGDSLYLVQDAHLRKHLGALMGDVAASHHWSIEKVGARLSRQINAPGEFPREWHIDAMKIAALLRCADALHVDNRRAPDFLHALLHRQGVSFSHWQAQNRIGRIDLDQSDQTGATILVTSTRPFAESEAACWWIAYDAAHLADQELRASNALLTARGAPPFRAKRIKGVESPERMADLIRADGWSPCSATIHVSNIESLVRTLGGENLYGVGGDHLMIVLRELIQNGRDAVRAREALDNDFQGKVLVRLRTDNGTCSIEVEDDGIGMSHRILTGPLLDFGVSFWTDSLVQEEFPGLRASKFRPVGKFGIGFYAVFMIADTVTVSSRRWDEAPTDTRQLIFGRGVTLRPLLKTEGVNAMSIRANTQIRLALKRPIDPDAIEINSHTLGAEDFSVPLRDYVSVLCAGLDVDVFVDTGNGLTRVHSRQPIGVTDRESWLRTIAFSAQQKNPLVDQYIAQHAARLRPIVEDGRCLGLAAISTLTPSPQSFFNVATVGGLATTVHGRGSHFIGFIDYRANSARREQSELAPSRESLLKWSEEQLELLRNQNIADIEWAVATYSFAFFGVDPTPFGRLAIECDDQLMVPSFEQLAEMVRTRPIVFFVSSGLHHVDSYQRFNVPSLAVFRPLMNSNFLSAKMDGDRPKPALNVLSCVDSAIVSKGLVPKWEIKKNVGHGALGSVDAIIVTA